MHVFIHGYLIFLIFRHITHLKNPRWLCGQITSSLWRTSLMESIKKLNLLLLRYLLFLLIFWLLTFIILFLLFADERECRDSVEGSLLPEVQGAFSVSHESFGTGADWRDWNALGHNHWGMYTEVLVENPNIHCIPCLFVPNVSTCEMWLNFIVFLFQDLHGKEKDLLLSESKEKIATREKALTRAKEVKTQLKI